MQERAKGNRSRPAVLWLSAQALAASAPDQLDLETATAAPWELAATAVAELLHYVARTHLSPTETFRETTGGPNGMVLIWSQTLMGVAIERLHPLV